MTTAVSAYERITMQVYITEDENTTATTLKQRNISTEEVGTERVTYDDSGGAPMKVRTSVRVLDGTPTTTMKKAPTVKTETQVTVQTGHRDKLTDWWAWFVNVLKRVV